MIDHNELTNLRADVPPMTEAAFLRGLQRLDEARTSATPSGRSRRPVYALIAAAAAAAVLVAGAVTIGHRSPSDSATATVLNDAAEHALQQPTLHPNPGQFVYQRVDSLGNDYAATIEYWIPADNTGKETICVSNDGCANIPYDKNAVKNQGLPYNVLMALPTNGAAMLAYLRADAMTTWQRSTGKSSDLAVWNTALQLGDLLPPAQQAALFLALARLHSTRLEGHVTTFDGRTGIAIGIQDPVAGDEQLVFTTDTHEYIGERNVQTHSTANPAKTDTVSFNSSRTVSAIVNHAQQRP